MSNTSASVHSSTPSETQKPLSTSPQLSSWDWQLIENELRATRRNNYENGIWYGQAVYAVVPLIHAMYVQKGVDLGSFVRDVSRYLPNVRPGEVVNVCADEQLSLPVDSKSYQSQLDSMYDKEIIKLFTTSEEDPSVTRFWSMMEDDNED